MFLDVLDKVLHGFRDYPDPRQQPMVFANDGLEQFAV